MSDKIKPQHVERKAILYIRQSSAYQVTHNLESQRLQYAMQDRLQYLGWREIEIVDDEGGAVGGLDALHRRFRGIRRKAARQQQARGVGIVQCRRERGVETALR